MIFHYANASLLIKRAALTTDRSLSYEPFIEPTGSRSWGVFGHETWPRPLVFHGGLIQRDLSHTKPNTSVSTTNM